MGTYCLTVTDGCIEKSECYTLVDCSSTNFEINGKVSNTCKDYDIGQIELNVSGGQPPYSFRWSDYTHSQNLTGLSTGMYCVTVTDNNGCRLEDCFTVGNGDFVEERDGCIFYRYCDGELVGIPEDIGSYGVVDPSDCNYVLFYCKDNYYLGRKHYGTHEDYDDLDCAYYSVYSNYDNSICDRQTRRAPIDYYFDCNTCTITSYCGNGQVYDQIIGTYFFNSFEGYDPQGGYFCFDMEWCRFNDVDRLGNFFSGDIISTRTNNLSFASIEVYDQDNNPTGYCNIQIFCNDNELYDSPTLDKCGSIPYIQVANITCNGPTFLGTDNNLPEKLDIFSKLLDEVNLQSVLREPENLKAKSLAVATNEEKNNYIKIYPNPFAGKFNIEYQSSLDELSNITITLKNQLLPMQFSIGLFLNRIA